MLCSVTWAVLAQRLSSPGIASQLAVLGTVGRLLCHPPALALTWVLPFPDFLPRFICLAKKGQQGGLIAPKAPVPRTFLLGPDTGEGNIAAPRRPCPWVKEPPLTSGPRMEGEIKGSNNVVRLN